MKRSTEPASVRKGAAAVEVAMLLPVYLLLAFGSIETANATYVKRDLTLAAYAAATELEDRRGTVTSARAEAVAVLQARSISNYVITIQDTAGTDLTDVTEGQTFTITVSAPFAGNSINTTRIFNATTLRGQVSMVRSL